MKRRALIVSLLGFTALTAACHKAKPVVNNAPVQGPGTPPPAPPPPPANVDRGAPPPPPATADPNELTRRLTASLAMMIHFDYDMSDIRPDDKAMLDSKVPILKANGGVRIRITGFCDERGSDEYNIALGMRRATAAKEYLVRAGIDAARIEVASLGREKPVDPSSNEGAWAKNRRDEFDVIAGGQNLRAP